MWYTPTLSCIPYRLFAYYQSPICLPLTSQPSPSGISYSEQAPLPAQRLYLDNVSLYSQFYLIGPGPRISTLDHSRSLPVTPREESRPAVVPAPHFHRSQHEYAPGDMTPICSAEDRRYASGELRHDMTYAYVPSVFCSIHIALTAFSGFRRYERRIWRMWRTAGIHNGPTRYAAGRLLAARAHARQLYVVRGCDLAYGGSTQRCRATCLPYWHAA